MSSQVYPSFVFVNGLLLPQIEAAFPVNDLAVLRGYGVFDFFLVKDGHPCFFEDHWARLQHSATTLNLRIPFGGEDLLRMVRLLHQKMPYPFAGCRITLTGGCSPDGYLPGEAPNSLVTLNALPFFSESMAPEGIGLMTHAYRRPYPAVKSIDYLSGIMMLPIARQMGFDEVLFVENGVVSECPRSNVFAMTADGVLITPGQNVLKGITRKRILQHARQMVKVEEREVKLQDLLDAKEVFISSTTKGIWPVKNIDGHLIGPGGNGEITGKLYGHLLAELKGLHQG